MTELRKWLKRKMRLRENSLKIKRDKNNKDGNEWKH
jgi:hypothetical protein